MEFGELRMESSRAFWDDYDEDEQPEFPKLEWVWQNEENSPDFPKEIDTLLIVEGFNVTDFFNSVLLKNRAPVAHLSVGQASVFEISEHKVTVCVVDEKDLNYFTPITKLLDPWIKVAKHVKAITFHSTAVYKGDAETFDTIDGCFFRAVYSDDAVISWIKKLEIPNIITGVSAGIISYCKFIHKPATCFVIYMEAPIFDSITTRPMIRLLKDLKIPCDDTFTYTKHHKNISGLYL